MISTVPRGSGWTRARPGMAVRGIEARRGLAHLATFLRSTRISAAVTPRSVAQPSMRGLPTSAASASTRRSSPSSSSRTRASSWRSRHSMGRVDAAVEGGAGGGDRLDDGAGAGRGLLEVGAGGDLGGGHGDCSTPDRRGIRRGQLRARRRAVVVPGLVGQHGLVGPGQVVVAQRAVGAGHADADAELDLGPRHLDRLPHRPGDPLGDLGGDPVGHLVGEDDELVAAGAGDDVAGAHAAAQAGGHHLQDLVADGVPVAVVDRLEVVEVAEEQRPAALVPVEEVEERPAVQEAGQLVGVGERVEAGGLVVPAQDQLDEGLRQLHAVGVDLGGHAVDPGPHGDEGGHPRSRRRAPTRSRGRPARAPGPGPSDGSRGRDRRGRGSPPPAGGPGPRGRRAWPRHHTGDGAGRWSRSGGCRRARTRRWPRGCRSSASRRRR